MSTIKNQAGYRIQNYTVLDLLGIAKFT